MLTVPAGNSAESVRISSTGAISYSFNVGDDKDDYAATYTRTVYVDGARVSLGTVEDVVDANGDLYGAVNIGNNYDKGNDVEVVITDLDLTPPVAPEPVVNPLLNAEVIGTNVYTNYAEIAEEGKADVVDYATLVKVALEEDGYSDVVVTVDNTDDSLDATGVMNGITFKFAVDPADATVAVVSSDDALDDAIASGAKTIYLTANEDGYQLNDSKIDSDVTIVGDGETVLKGSASTSGEPNTIALDVREGATLKVSGVVFDDAFNGIVTLGSGKVEIEDCIFNVTNMGVYVGQGTPGGYIKNCVFNMKEGSYVAIGAYGLADDLEISGNTFNGVGSVGYDVETFANNGDHLKVTGATVLPLD